MDAYEREYLESLSPDTKRTLTNQFICNVIHGVVNENLFVVLYKANRDIKVPNIVDLTEFPDLSEQLDQLNQYIRTGKHDNEKLVQIAESYKDTYFYEATCAILAQNSGRLQ